MARKITIEPPCEVGELFFVIFSSTNITGIYRWIDPARVSAWEYISNGKYLITAYSINNEIKTSYITIGENAFKDIFEAENALLRLRDKDKKGENVAK